MLSSPAQAEGQISDAKLSVCEFDVGPEDAAMVGELLGTIDVQTACWQNWETGAAKYRVYASPEEETAARQRVEQLLQGNRDLLCGGVPELRFSSIAKEDWSEAWKRHFHTFRASDRLVVKPSWEEYDRVDDAIVLEIDPGMTFGTGYHGTTRACLQFLDALALDLGSVSLLDAGCGSGILSLAAAKLGYDPIRAFDHDPDAVRMTAENLRSAGVIQVQPTCGDLGEIVPDFPCRVVVANILATVLDAHAERIISFVDRAGGPGHLILSGILTGQYGGIRERFTRLGAVEVEQRTIAEWASGRFVLNLPLLKKSMAAPVTPLLPGDVNGPI